MHKFPPKNGRLYDFKMQTMWAFSSSGEFPKLALPKHSQRTPNALPKHSQSMKNRTASDNDLVFVEASKPAKPEKIRAFLRFPAQHTDDTHTQNSTVNGNLEFPFKIWNGVQHVVC